FSTRLPRSPSLFPYTTLFRSIDYPLVFKPTNASLGDGVVTNIDDEDELREAIFYVREELGYPDAVLEQHVEGREFRVYVVHDKVDRKSTRLNSSHVSISYAVF